MPATDRSFLIGVSVSGAHSRRIMHNGRGARRDFDVEFVYVRDFGEHYRADLAGAFDFVLMEVSGAALEAACEDRLGARVRSLECVTGIISGPLNHLDTAV